MITIQFQQLWDSHPLNLTPPENHPCKKKDGTPAFDNQCAIKMSIALMGASVNLDACNKVKCWFGHTNHVIRAQELADWLAEAAQLGTPTRYTKGRRDTESIFQQTVLSGIQGKKGTVFCQNFWGTGNQGDHIDVWDGSTMSGGYGNSSYYGRSQQVWFWEINV
jgi:hypothetical protein